jgi:hypothetical protein
LRPFIREALFLCTEEVTDEKVIDRVCLAAVTGVNREEWETLEYILRNGEISSSNEKVKSTIARIKN